MVALFSEGEPCRRGLQDRCSRPFRPYLSSSATAPVIRLRRPPGHPPACRNPSSPGSMPPRPPCSARCGQLITRFPCLASGYRMLEAWAMHWEPPSIDTSTLGRDKQDKQPDDAGHDKDAGRRDHPLLRDAVAESAPVPGPDLDRARAAGRRRHAALIPGDAGHRGPRRCRDGRKPRDQDPGRGRLQAGRAGSRRVRRAVHLYPGSHRPPWCTGSFDGDDSRPR